MIYNVHLGWWGMFLTKKYSICVCLYLRARHPTADDPKYWNIFTHVILLSLKSMLHSYLFMLLQRATASPHFRFGSMLFVSPTRHTAA